jgi:hypothetical protein
MKANQATIDVTVRTKGINLYFWFIALFWIERKPYNWKIPPFQLRIFNRRRNQVFQFDYNNYV